MGLAFNKCNSWPKVRADIQAGLVTVAGWRVALTNTLPTVAQTDLDLVTNHPPPTVGNGYPSGGYTLTGLVAATVNTNQATLSAAMLTPSATGSDWTAFRYLVFYVTVAGAYAGNKLRGFVDLGLGITLAAGQQRQLKWGGISGVGPIATLT